MGNVILTGQSGSGGGGIDFEGTLVDNVKVPDGIDRYQFIKPTLLAETPAMTRIVNTYGSDASSPYTGQQLLHSYHLGGTRYLQLVNIYSGSVGVKVRMYDMSVTSNTNTSLGYTLGFSASGSAMDSYTHLFKDGLLYVIGLTSSYSRLTWWVFSIPETGNTPVLENTGYVTNSIGYYLHDLTPVDGIPNKYMMIQKASPTSSDTKIAIRLLDIVGTTITLGTAYTYSGNAMPSESYRGYPCICKVGTANTDPAQYMLILYPSTTSNAYLPFKVSGGTVTFGTLLTETTVYTNNPRGCLRLGHGTNQVLHYLVHDNTVKIRNLTVDNNVITSTNVVITSTNTMTNTSLALNREYNDIPLSNNTFAYVSVSMTTLPVDTTGTTYIAVVTPVSMFIYENVQSMGTAHGSYSGTSSRCTPYNLIKDGDVLRARIATALNSNSARGAVVGEWSVKLSAVPNSFVGAHGLADKGTDGDLVMLIPN